MTALHTVDTVVVGAGHAGLAVSRLLTKSGRDHVVLERGRVGQRWLSERWESLHLLTPNWMTSLPGWHYSGPDPEGFLPAGQFARHLERYAGSFEAPVLTGTTVECLAAGPGGSYLVHTDRGTWRTLSVVVATGPHGSPVVPNGIEASVPVITSNRYRKPDALPGGGVLVVGASSSGVQIADEIASSGRDVVFAVGRHTRMPRTYRGMDVFWWLEATGRLARTIDEVSDAAAARREPSMQLVGRNGDGPADIDLAALQRRGVRLAGRLEHIAGRVATFGDALPADVRDAEQRMHRFLDAVDGYVDRAGLRDEVLAATRPAAVPVGPSPTRLDLAAEGIGAVVLATGFRPDHAWLHLPIKESDGTIRQHRGVTDAPGVYVVGQRFQHRRDSGFIGGVRYDAQAVVAHLNGEPPMTTSRHGEVPSEEPA